MRRRGRPRHPDILTPREWEVLALLREGLSNPEIAVRLGIGREGVKSHVSEILGKLGVASREDAARWAPTERAWWAGAAAPMAWLWRRASVSWLATGAAGIAAVLVVAGVALLIWGLARTDGDGGSISARAEALTYLETGESEALPIEPDSFGNRYLSWSPDGSVLAFIKDADIWLLDDAGDETNLTSTPDRIEGLPRWSHDGELIAFASRERLPDEGPNSLSDLPGTLSLMNADGSSYRSVGEGNLLWPPSWSADDQQIAYASNGLVSVYDLTDDTASAYSAVDLGLRDAVYVNGVSWSPVEDELAVYFSQSDVSPTREELVSGDVPVTIQGYLISDPMAGHAEIIMQYEAPFHAAPPAEWSPDGSRLLIALNSSPKFQNPSGLWIVDRSTLAIEQVADLVPYQALWSPSGEMIAYIDNGTHGVQMLSAETLAVVDQPGPSRGVRGIAWRPAAP